ncbi:hypothetical protein JXL19_09420 [bacterium]|nr:hypothetical protein [bacterium]
MRKIPIFNTISFLLPENPFWVFSLSIIIFIMHILIPNKAGSLSFDTGFHYTNWEYGPGEKTTYISAPLHIKGQPFKHLALEMTVPYIYQKNTGMVRIGDSIYPAVSDKGNSPPYGKTWGLKKYPYTLYSGNIQEGVSNDASYIEGISDSEHGIGDIYILFSSDFNNIFKRFPNYVPAVDLYSGIKLPAASSKKGLGTGEYDYTIGLDMVWETNKIAYSLYGDYTWVGDTEYENFKNITCFGCGADIEISSNYLLILNLSGCTPVYSDGSNSYSLELGIKRKILKDHWIHFYGMAGLNEESPDYGFGLSIGFNFDRH